MICSVDLCMLAQGQSSTCYKISCNNCTLHNVAQHKESMKFIKMVVMVNGLLDFNAHRTVLAREQVY